MKRIHLPGRLAPLSHGAGRGPAVVDRFERNQFSSQRSLNDDSRSLREAVLTLQLYIVVLEAI